MGARAISVLLPCRNAAATLPEALESLLRQSYGDIEVLAVDDGSEDGTLEVLRGYAAQDARIVVLEQPQAGIIAALNAAAAVARGRYLARMDADDISTPERFALQAALLDAQPEIALVSGIVRGFPAIQGGFAAYLDWLNALQTPDDIAREIFVESPLVHPSVMLRRAWFERVGGYQEHGWPEDYDLWLRLHLAGARFAKVPELVLEWRDHAERLTRSDERYAIRRFMAAKAHYLALGPLHDRDAIIIWGAGKAGGVLSRLLLEKKLPLAAFIDIDPRKVGGTRRAARVYAPQALPELWASYERPALLAAVGSRGARPLIRERIAPLGLVEGRDWWCAA